MRIQRSLRLLKKQLYRWKKDKFIRSIFSSKNESSVLLPNIFNHPFTYLSDQELSLGDYVEVPFEKKMIGVVWDDFEKV